MMKALALGTVCFSLIRIVTARSCAPSASDRRLDPGLLEEAETIKATVMRIVIRMGCFETNLVIMCQINTMGSLIWSLFHTIDSVSSQDREVILK